MRIYECKYTNQISKVLTNAKKGYFCQFKRTYALEVDGKIYGVVMNIFERIWATFLKVFGTDVIKNKFGRKKIKQATVKDLKIREEQLLRILKMHSFRFLGMEQTKFIAKLALNQIHDNNVQREINPDFNPDEDFRYIDLSKINSSLKIRGFRKSYKTDLDVALRYLLMQGKIIWKLSVGRNREKIGIKETLNYPEMACTADKLIEIDYKFFDVEQVKMLVPAQALSPDMALCDRVKKEIDQEVSEKLKDLNKGAYQRAMGGIIPDVRLNREEKSRNFVNILREEGIIDTFEENENNYIIRT